MIREPTVAGFAAIMPVISIRSSGFADVKVTVDESAPSGLTGLAIARGGAGRTPFDLQKWRFELPAWQPQSDRIAGALSVASETVMRELTPIRVVARMAARMMVSNADLGRMVLPFFEKFPVRDLSPST